jgi:predicted acetyltransferase
MVVLLHVATAPHARRKGAFRRLLVEVRQLAPSELPVVAETDHNAVHFYRALGFTAISLGERYPAWSDSASNSTVSRGPMAETGSDRSRFSTCEDACESWGPQRQAGSGPGGDHSHSGDGTQDTGIL